MQGLGARACKALPVLTLSWNFCLEDSDRYKHLLGGLTVLLGLGSVFFTSLKLIRCSGRASVGLGIFTYCKEIQNSPRSRATSTVFFKKGSSW